MEQRIDDAQHTGTLPVTGGEALPVTGAAPARGPRPAWVDEARGGLTFPGRYLAYEEAGRPVVVPIAREWTRIGRSLTADVRFDDATVSRRHAQVVSDGGGARVLDDRSLNGVTVNGRRVELSQLADGDEIGVGRHTLYFLDTATVGRPVAAEAAAAPGS